MQAPNCVFPSLTDNTHIMGPMSEISCAFDHLLTQLTQVGFKVQMSKCKFWNPLGIFPGIEILLNCILVTNGFRSLGVLMGSHDFAMHFLDEALCQDVVHIDDFPLLGNTQIVLGILSSCIVC